MKTDILTTEVIDNIAVVTLGSLQKMYFDLAMGDTLTEELQAFADDPDVRVVIITGGTPGNFNRHFDIPAPSILPNKFARRVANGRTTQATTVVNRG